MENRYNLSLSEQEQQWIKNKYNIDELDTMKIKDILLKGTEYEQYKNAISTYVKNAKSGESFTLNSVIEQCGLDIDPKNHSLRANFGKMLANMKDVRKGIYCNGARSYVKM